MWLNYYRLFLIWLMVTVYDLCQVKKIVNTQGNRTNRSHWKNEKTIVPCLNTSSWVFDVTCHGETPLLLYPCKKNTSCRLELKITDAYIFISSQLKPTWSIQQPSRAGFLSSLPHYSPWNTHRPGSASICVNNVTI